MLVLGLALAAAGFWWLWGGRRRWLPGSRYHRTASQPTRMVVGLAHLVLGYHLVFWNVPDTQQRAIKVPYQHWYVLVLGCGVAIAGSFALDRVAPIDDEDDQANSKSS